MKRLIFGLLFCGLLISSVAGLGRAPVAHAAAVGPSAGTPSIATPARPHHMPLNPAGGAGPTNGAGPASNGPLFYFGGQVILGTHKTHAIFWGPGFTTSYKNLIITFLQDVAAASGAHSNVYFSATQYWQLSGSHITYDEHFAGAFSDPTLPASGCSDTHGGTTRCITDAQIRAEVNAAILWNGWGADGVNKEYFVFLPDGVSTCDGSGCAFDGTPSGFCAYHSANEDILGRTVTYANMPFAGHDLGGCGFGEAPNNNPAADAEVSAISHEANEMITDPLVGTGWLDLSGAETGDKCRFALGTMLGGTFGHEFNQVINGNHYLLQEEWSNASNGCVQRGQ